MTSRVVSVLGHVGAFALVALAVAACGSSTATASHSLQPLRGNGVTIPFPSDAPAQVLSLPAVFSCGGEQLEGDEEAAPPASGASTAPGAGTVDDPGAACLIRASDERRPAQYVVAEQGDEGAADRYTLYRVVGDGSVMLFVRAASSGLDAPSWNRLVCHGLSLTDEGINPDGCGSPESIK